jgi:serine-type D-Ala-D-Ala carboxypeptidase (penicillin-binding protein 5/6)
VKLGLHWRVVLAAALVLGLLSQPGNVTEVLASEDESPITARNAIVVDANSGQVLFDKGMDEQVPPASLTKIFTAIVALETAALNTSMTVDEYDLVGEASIGLVADESVDMETLLHGLMLTSGNDAAMTISRELGYLPGDTPQESVSRFIDRVNATAERLGLEDTSLRNPHGLDQGNHYSSASDIAAMTIYALDNPVFEDIISTPYYAFNGREFYNVNQFLDVYPGLIGGKTGITTKAGHSLMQVAERDGNRVVVVLLGSDRDNWYLDAEYLLNLGFEELETNPDDETRPVVGVAGVTGLDIPELATGQSVGGNLTIDRVNDNEAIIRPNSPVSAEESMAWHWLLISIGLMGVALVLVLNYQAILGLGAMAFARGSKIRVKMPPVPSIPSPGRIFERSPRHRRRQSAGVGWQPEAIEEHRTEVNLDLLRTTRRERDVRNGERAAEPFSQSNASSNRYSPEVRVSPARSRAEHGITLTMQGRYRKASEEFRLALEQDPDVDITNCPGFWRMQPMGYIAVAKAYAMHKRLADARRLLTVVQLAHKQNDELVSLFGRAIRELEDPFDEE